jgi:hypothetical protein
MKLALRETFGGIKYGDNHRKPSRYLPTHTKRPPFRGRLPKDTPMQSEKNYQRFPKLSQTLLLSLFAGIGVKYLPEICLYQLQTKRPIEVFEGFVLSFGVGIEDRLEQREIVDAEILNQVILSLREMDEARQVRRFDSRPIYRLLARHEFIKVDEIIKNRKE